MMLDRRAGPAPCRTVTQCGRAFYTWDTSSGRLRWGGSCEPILGHAPWDMPDTITGWLGAVYPDDRLGARLALDTLLVDRQPLRMEYRVVRSDEQVVRVASHAAFVADFTIIGSVARAGGPTVSMWEAVGDDLSGSEPPGGEDRDLALFFALSEDLLCIAGTDGYFRRVNQKFGRLLGYPDEELLAHPLLDFVHPDDVSATRAAMARLEQGLTVVQFRNRYRTAAGRYRWLEWTARSVPAACVVYAVARDVTERVELEQRLRTREARERAILDHTPAAIYVKAPDGRYEFVNEPFARRLGLPPAKVVGRTDADLFPTDAARAAREADLAVLRTAETHHTEETVPHADGHHTYLAVRFPVPDATGQVAAVAGIATDITEHLRSQATEKEVLTARRVQQRLYPAAAPVVAGFDAAGRGMSASQLCGDYFDFVPRGGRLVAVVGDVCGHGIGPALTMVETRATVRLLLAAGDPLPDLLSRLNRQLQYDTGDLTFVSLFLAEVILSTRAVTYAGAGHVAYIVRAPSGDECLPSTGPLLGVDPVATYAAEAAPPLAAGDVLVLLTDGVVEAMNPAGEQFGAARALDVVRRCRTAPAREIIHTLFAAVTVFTNDRPLADDMTAIVLKAV